MSLISPKNFLTPLTNIWHLATIAVIALLFGVYRMAGGGINIENIKKPLNSEYLGTRSLQDSAPAAKTTLNKQEKKALPAENSKSTSELLDDLIAKDNPEPESNNNSGNDSPLDDIAKQLGAD